MKDYYSLLHVSATATQPEIRKAYYRLAQQFHPDKTTDPGHHRHFLEIKEAYEILGDKNQREIYHYRWQQFKNPVRPASQPASKPGTYQPRPATPNYPPPHVARHYQNYAQPTYREYEPALRQICFIALGLGLLILLDLILAYRLPDQIIQQMDMAREAGRPSNSIMVYTQDCHFRVRLEDVVENEISIGKPLTAWKTPFFRQTINVVFYSQKIGVNQGGVYHNFLWIVLLQTGCAIFGLITEISWPSRMNLGILAGIFTALTLILMVLNF